MLHTFFLSISIDTLDSTQTVRVVFTSCETFQLVPPQHSSDGEPLRLDNFPRPLSTTFCPRSKRHPDPSSFRRRESIHKQTPSLQVAHPKRHVSQPELLPIARACEPSLSLHTLYVACEHISWKHHQTRRVYHTRTAHHLQHNGIFTLEIVGIRGRGQG